VASTALIAEIQHLGRKLSIVKIQNLKQGFSFDD